MPVYKSHDGLPMTWSRLQEEAGIMPEPNLDELPAPVREIIKTAKAVRAIFGEGDYARDVLNLCLVFLSQSEILHGGENDVAVSEV